MEKVEIIIALCLVRLGAYDEMLEDANEILKRRLAYDTGNSIWEGCDHVRFSCRFEGGHGGDFLFLMIDVSVS